MEPVINDIEEYCKIIEERSNSYFKTKLHENFFEFSQFKDLFSLIFENISEDSEYIEKLIQISSNFLVKLTNRFFSFFENSEESEELAKILNVFIKGKLSKHFVNEFTEIIIIFIENQFENYKFYNFMIPFIEEYLSNDVFFTDLIKKNAIKTLFSVPFRPNTREFCQIIFKFLSAKISIISKCINNKNFATYLADVIRMIHPHNADQAIGFISKYLNFHSADVVKEFIKNDGFINANNAIVSDELHSGIVLYSTGAALIEKTKEGHYFPVFKSFLCLLVQIKEEDSDLIETLFSIFIGYTKSREIVSPFVSNADVGVMFSKANSTKCALKLFIALKNLAVRFNFPLDFHISKISTYLTQEFLLENNSETLLELCVLMMQKDYWLVVPFVTQLFTKTNDESFIKILLTYKNAQTLFSMMFTDKVVINNFTDIIIKFFECDLCNVNFEIYYKIFRDLIASEPFREEFVNVITKLGDKRDVVMQIIHTFTVYASEINREESVELCKKLLQIIDLIENKTEAEKKTILDLLAMLSRGCFQQNLDKMICDHLESHNFYDETEKELSKLAFGIKQEEEIDSDHQHLCYPSILYKCGQFRIVSPFDSFICSIYAIDKWIEKTGKQIIDFPSIEFISNVFLTTKQADLLLQHPRFCSTLLKPNNSFIQSFEFTKGYNSSNFNIPTKACENQNGVSFWFMFKEEPENEQIIVTYGPISVAVKGRSLHCNGKQIISSMNINDWNFIFIIITEDHFAKVFVNADLVYDETVQEKEIICEMGSDKCYANWFIGSGIRVYRGFMLPSIVKDVYEKGVNCTYILSKQEFAVYSPGFFVNGEDGSIDTDAISVNAMPVINQSIKYFITAFLNNEVGIFKKILQLLSESNNENLIRDYFEFLISIRMNRNSKLPAKKFFLILSCIFYFAPYLFNVETIKALISVDNFDEDAFLMFFQDPLIYDLAQPSEIIALFKEVLEVHQINNSNLVKFHRFLISLLLKAQNGHGEEILKFLLDLNPSPDILFRYIPLFIGNQFFDSIFNETLKFVDTSFTAFYLFASLPEDATMKLIFKYTTSFDDCLPPKVKQIMNICMLNCDQVYSWSTAFSIVVRGRVNLEETLNFEFDEINADVLPEFFIMISVLLSASDHLNDKFNGILRTVVDFIKLITEDLTFSNKELFAIIQMLGFGRFSDGFVCFPFSPSTTTIQETMEYARKRGQAFPENIEYMEYNPPEIKQLSDIEETVISFVDKIIPNITVMSQTLEISNNELKNTIIKGRLQSTKIAPCWSSWKDFVMKQITKFTGDNKLSDSVAETSIYFLEIVQFVVNALVERINDPKFINNFVFITFATGMFTANQSKLIMLKITLNILAECCSKSIYSEDLINFVSARIIEGWMTNSYAPTLSLILQIMRSAEVSEIPDSVLGLLLQGFELVPINQYHIFAELFINCNDYIFSDTNLTKLSFVVTLLDRLILNCDYYRDSFVVFLGLLKKKIEESDFLRDFWNSQQKLKLSVIFDIIDAIAEGKDGFSKWEKENEEISADFNLLREKALDQFTSINKTFLSKTLEGVIETRKELNDAMFEIGNKYILSESSLKVYLSTSGKIINEFCYETLAFDESLFFRERESVLLNSDTIDTNESDEENTVNLSTIFMPVFYHSHVPKSTGKLYNTVLLPPLRDSLFINRKKDRYSLVTSKLRSYLFAFSESFYQKSLMKDKLIQIMLNDANSFDFNIQSTLIFGDKAVEGKLFGDKEKIFFLPSKNSLEKIAEKIIAGWLGNFVFFEGIPILKFYLVDVCTISPFVYKENINCISFILVNGISLLFTVSCTLSVIKDILSDFCSDIYKHLPNETTCRSISNNTRLLMKSQNAVIGMWKSGEIDNLKLIAYLNYHIGRSFSHFPRLPVYPNIEPNVANFYNYEKMLMLQNKYDIAKWINKEFDPSIEISNDSIKGYFTQTPSMMHIMMNPKKLFWFSIKVADFCKPSRVQISDNHVYVYKGKSIIFPPDYNSIVTVINNNKQMVKINCNNEISPIEIIALGSSLRTVSIFEISNDALFYAFGHYDRNITIGRFVYSKSSIISIKINAKISLPDKPTSIVISSAQFLVAVACQNSVHLISLATNKVIRQIDLDYAPIKVLIDDCAAEIVVLGAKTVSIYDLDGKRKSLFNTEEEILCAEMAQLPLYIVNRFFVIGHVNGVISFWNGNRLIRKLETGLEDIKCISIDRYSQRIAFCTESNAFIASFYGNTSKPLTDDHAFICAKCGCPIEKKPFSCNSCHRFFCSKCSEQNKIIKDIIKKNQKICDDCK